MKKSDKLNLRKILEWIGATGNNEPNIAALNSLNDKEKEYWIDKIKNTRINKKIIGE